MSQSSQVDETIQSTQSNEALGLEEANEKEEGGDQLEHSSASNKTDEMHSSDTNLPLGNDRSLVEYYGLGDNFCGYCKQTGSQSGGRRSYDMKAYKLKADDYQHLMDRGWRRSGNYCYNPVNSDTCCPNYPISCKALKFKLTRSQRRCIRNVNSFVLGTDRCEVSLSKTNVNNCAQEVDGGSSRIVHKDHRTFEQFKASNKLKDRRFVKSCERKVRVYNISLEDAILRTKERSRIRNHKPAPVLENYLYPKRTSLSIAESEIKPKHKLSIKLLHVESNECKALLKDEHIVFTKYQQAIHKEESEEWSMSRFSEFLVNSPLVVEPIPICSHPIELKDSDDTLTFNHHSNDSSFLVTKPPNLPTHYGPYHCVYLLDDKLIAVGVLDVLTKCVTTVYFFYDPLYKHLNLGTYSALVEISLVRQLSKFYKEPVKDKLVHYYLGFYVHECKKMHYKTTFQPSYLLCSETYTYVPTEECLEKLKDKKYARFRTHTDIDNLLFLTQIPALEDILVIPVKAPCIESDKMLDYLKWLELNLGVQYVDILINNILLQYSQLVGRELTPKLTLQVNAVHNALVHRHRRLAEINDSTTSSDKAKSSGSGGDNNQSQNLD